MKDGLTWYAVNNTATAADAPDLAPFGVNLLARSDEPVAVQRDPVSGRLIAQIGLVKVIRDGPVCVVPRLDCPPVGVDLLVSTALDCIERDLHRRDHWAFRRSGKGCRAYWSALIAMSLPDGSPLFAAHAAALAARPLECMLPEQLHPAQDTADRVES